MQILLAQINQVIGDLSGNTERILQAIDVAKQRKAQIVCFPELSLCGYPANDFLLQPHFIQSFTPYLEKIVRASRGIAVIVGLARPSDPESEKLLYNSACIIQDGKILGYQDKSLLPTYDVFDEHRYFEPAKEVKVWNLLGKKIAITICEDIWQHSRLLAHAHYRRDPIEELRGKKPDIALNLSASPYSLGKFFTRFEVCQKAARSLNAPLLLCNQVGGNDGLIFDGNSLYVGSKGELLGKGKAFEEDLVLIDLEGDAETLPPKQDTMHALYQALVLGVSDYFKKQGFKKACLGLSGGIDSALAACIAVKALGAENVFGFIMPSRYSSKGSVEDAKALAQNLNMHAEEISIEKPFQCYLDLLTPYFQERPVDATEENLQARIRGMILMAMSNKFGYILLSTGNKSELAMGYATLYGDMCGGLGVLSDVTKRQVYALSRFINKEKEIIPWSTIQKPPSAELRANQKDSDSLPDYEVIDNVLSAYVEEHLSSERIAQKFHYPIELVNDLVRRIHQNEYKRRQGAFGLRVTEKAFSVGRSFPIVQQWIK